MGIYGFKSMYPNRASVDAPLILEEGVYPKTLPLPPKRMKKMYILTQDRGTLINFDNFHEIFMDEGCIYAKDFCEGKKIAVCLGTYNDQKELEFEFEQILKSLGNKTKVHIMG